MFVLGYDECGFPDDGAIAILIIVGISVYEQLLVKGLDMKHIGQLFQQGNKGMSGGRPILLLDDLFIFKEYFLGNRQGEFPRNEASVNMMIRRAGCETDYKHVTVDDDSHYWPDLRK
jgi:hypothetical protein